MTAVTADLAQYPTTTLLQAIAERLAMIELRTLEHDCLLPRPQADLSIYERMQVLLTAARRPDDEERLVNAVNALSDIRLPGDDRNLVPESGDDAELAGVGDIVALGQRHALLHRRYTELQRLYKTRMKVTQDYAAKLRAKYEPAENE